MKQILGLDTGYITFTPGSAGTSTVAISGVNGFAPSRLMAITNITRKQLLYAAESGQGNAGIWSNINSTGGILTLDKDTVSSSGADILRVIYESGQETTSSKAMENSVVYKSTGNNILQKDMPDWYRGTNITKYEDSYNDSPIPGVKASHIVFSGGSDGLSQTTFLNGRTDGVGLSFSFWARSIDISGGQFLTVQLALQDGAGGNVDVSHNTTGGIGPIWKRYYFSGICQTSNATLAYTLMYSPSLGSNVEVAGFMLNFGDQPQEYSPPALRFPTAGAYYKAEVPIVNRTSIYMLGDSFVGGANSFEHRTELSRLTNGSLIYNAGVGGETSTQVYARWSKIYAKSGWVVIEAGRNDGSSISTILTNISGMVSQVPHSRFIVCPVMNSATEPLSGSTCQYIEALNSELALRYGDRFANYRPALIANRPDHTPRPEFLSDTLHPNAFGHGIIAQHIADVIKKLDVKFGSTADHKITPVPDTTCGAGSFIKYISAASTNAVNLKPVAVSVNSLSIFNDNTNKFYVKLYNSAITPTLSSDVPIMTFPIQNSTAHQINCGPFGIKFSNGLSIAMTRNLSDTDTTAISANEGVINISYT